MLKQILEYTFVKFHINLSSITQQFSPHLYVYASVNSTYAQHPPPHPRVTAGHLPALAVPGVGHLQILHCPGTARGPHVVSYQNITTQKVLLEKKQIGSSVKDRNKL